MDAVWVRFRAELRSRWRAWLVVAIFTGIFGGAVLAATNGASRANSVTDRALARERSPDIFLVPAFVVGDDKTLAKISFENLRKLPSVSDGSRAYIFEAQESVDTFAPVDARLGSKIFLSKLLEGRIADPRDPNAATINILASQKLHLHAGDSYTLHFNPMHPPGEYANLPPGQAVKLRIVGVSANSGDVIPVAQPGFALTPAFWQRYGSTIQSYDFTMLYLDHRPGAYDRFAQDLSKLTGGERVFYVEARAGAEQARRSFRLQGASLWILAGFLALVGLLMLGQTLARQVFLDSSDFPALRSLGFSPRGLFILTFARAAAIGLVGALIAVGVGAAASIATPLGLARVIEPEPGIWMPFASTVLGLFGVVGTVLLMSAFPAWRAVRVARLPTYAQEPSARRPRALGELVARLFRSPAATVGTRMAIEPGRGRTAAPVRTTIIGTAIGVTSLVVALIVAGSIQHMTTTPRVYGWDWDLRVAGPNFDEPATRRAISTVPGVAQISFGAEGGQLVLQGHTLTSAFVMELGSKVATPILEGRAPASVDEVAVGRKTLRAIGRHLGDTVRVRLQSTERERDFRIVGVTVIPDASDVATLGEGVWITLEGGRTFDTDVIPNDLALVRLAPGSNAGRVGKLIQARLADAQVSGAVLPSAVVDFGHVSGMPTALAGIVALLAAGTLAHGITTSVRRRRRDLAILKTLGLDRRGVRSSVAWQSSVTVLITLAVGLPVGIAAGRWIWTLFAHQSGFVAEPVVSAVTIGGAALGALVLANVIAALPARSAARTRPALILRSE